MTGYVTPTDDDGIPSVRRPRKRRLRIEQHLARAWQADNPRPDWDMSEVRHRSWLAIADDDVVHDAANGLLIVPFLPEEDVQAMFRFASVCEPAVRLWVEWVPLLLATEGHWSVLMQAKVKVVDFDPRRGEAFVEIVESLNGEPAVGGAATIDLHAVTACRLSIETADAPPVPQDVPQGRRGRAFQTPSRRDPDCWDPHRDWRVDVQIHEDGTREPLPRRERGVVRMSDPDGRLGPRSPLKTDWDVYVDRSVRELLAENSRQVEAARRVLRSAERLQRLVDEDPEMADDLAKAILAGSQLAREFVEDELT